MIVGYYEWKNLYKGKTDLYLRKSSQISFLNIKIIDSYGVELQVVKVYDQFTSMYNGKGVLGLRVDNLDFIPELCIGGRIEDAGC